MTPTPTDRLDLINAAQTAANNERLRLIADALVVAGHRRPTGLTVNWYKGQESGLPLPCGMTLSGPDGETFTEEDLPEPAYQTLLALLEQDFDPSLEESEAFFDLSELGAQGPVTQSDLLLLGALIESNDSVSAGLRDLIRRLTPLAS